MRPYLSRALTLATLVIAAACGDGGGEEAATPPQKVYSGFDVDADGWMIVGDAQASSVTPDYNGTGGNPGGLISAVDDVTGGIWYFDAPAKYLGDNASTYGKSLRYDLKTTPITNPFDAADVVLEGDGLVIWYDTSPAPGTTWTSYSVPLTEAGWKSGAYATPTAVSDADFRRVLGAMTAFRIRGEFNSGSDTGSLDNVRFGAVP